MSHLGLGFGGEGLEEPIGRSEDSREFLHLAFPNCYGGILHGASSCSLRGGKKRDGKWTGKREMR